MPGSTSWENSSINPAIWRPHYSPTSLGLCLPSHLPVGKHPIILEAQEFSSGKNTHTSSKRTEGYIFYPNVVRGSGVLARAKVPTDPPGSSVACPTAPQLHLGKPITHPKIEWQIHGQEKPVPLLSISGFMAS